MNKVPYSRYLRAKYFRGKSAKIDNSTTDQASVNSFEAGQVQSTVSFKQADNSREIYFYLN